MQSNNRRRRPTKTWKKNFMKWNDNNIETPHQQQTGTRNLDHILKKNVIRNNRKYFIYLINAFLLLFFFHTVEFLTISIFVIHRSSWPTRRMKYSKVDRNWINLFSWFLHVLFCMCVLLRSHLCLFPLLVVVWMSFRLLKYYCFFYCYSFHFLFCSFNRFIL